MLVIVSDLHFTDGSTGMRIPLGAFRAFRERLESMAYDASKREDGTYRPIREFDLVLLGDIFDLLRTTQWNNEKKGEAGYARPWSKAEDRAFVNKIEQIVDGIIGKNAETFDLLHSLADGTAISLPPPTAAGQVDRRVSRDRRSPSRLPVKVNIHYMNGNHDWYFHLPGDDFNRIRRKVIERMGLSNPATPFPYEPGDSPAIQTIFAAHRVVARHGDKFDPFNYVESEKRNYASLGDALVVELFNPLPVAIQTELGERLPAEFYADLPEMGSVRPGTMTPVWLAGLLERHNVEKKYRGAITEIWKQLISDFLNLDFLKKMDRWGPDPADAIQLLLNILRVVALDTLDDIAPIADRLIKLHTSIWGTGELDKKAAEEQAYKSQEARFVVYGHTHGFKVTPLRSGRKDNQPFDQIYINSGTWHPLHELGVVDPHKRSFITHNAMSYVAFYQGDERKGRAFETWSGALEL